MEQRQRDAFVSIVGVKHALWTREERSDHALDAYATWRYVELVATGASLPDLVLRPGSKEEVQDILRFASQEGCAVAIHGGGTGVMGAAIPARHSVVIDLRRMNRLRAVHPDSMVAIVEAGAVLADADAALAAHGLMLGHDPWSQPIATVGGAISTDGVGYLAAIHGSMGDQVIGVEAVFPTGDGLDARAISIRAGSRLDLVVVGAEGTLGVITAATLRVFPRPLAFSVHAVGFASFAAGFAAVGAMTRAGVQPSMVDLTEEDDGSGRFGTTLYLAFQGTPAIEHVLTSAGLGLCRENGGRVLKQNIATAFWEKRHSSAERWARRTKGGRRHAVIKHPSKPSSEYLHLSIPSDQVIKFRERCERLLESEGLAAREYAIWGRPDLFSVAFGATESGPQDVSAVAEVLIREAQDLGGSMEYCHGVGLKLRQHLGNEGIGRLSALASIKRALDPAGILTPGGTAA